MRTWDEVEDLSKQSGSYYRKRYGLMLSIISAHDPVLSLSVEDRNLPYCEVCGAGPGDDVDELHVHHGDGKPRDPEVYRGGGYQAVLRYVEDWERGAELYVVCPLCHFFLHRAAGEDEDADRVRRRFGWMEQYETDDPDFMLKQRRKKKGERGRP